MMWTINWAKLYCVLICLKSFLGISMVKKQFMGVFKVVWIDSKWHSILAKAAKFSTDSRQIVIILYCVFGQTKDYIVYNGHKICKKEI